MIQMANEVSDVAIAITKPWRVEPLLVEISVTVT
jgi:hypothetical protein